MKRLSGLIYSFAIICLLLGAGANADTLRFGVDLNYPPFSSLGSDGKPHGFDVEVAYALCNDMKVNCQIVYQDWPGLVKALDMGKFDAILSSMEITTERKKVVDFTSPYYATPSRLLAAPGVQIAQLGVEHARIGVLTGSTQEYFAQKRWANQGAVVLEYDKTAMALHDLKNHHLDGVLIDCVAGDLALNGPLQNAGMAYVGPVYHNPAYFGEGAGIAVKKGDSALLNRLNQALADLRANGVLQGLKQRYFSARPCGA
jgi:arginine/ornithine transport system substrate-binding protein